MLDNDAIVVCEVVQIRGSKDDVECERTVIKTDLSEETYGPPSAGERMPSG